MPRTAPAFLPAEIGDALAQELCQLEKVRGFSSTFFKWLRCFHWAVVSFASLTQNHFYFHPWTSPQCLPVGPQRMYHRCLPLKQCHLIELSAAQVLEMFCIYASQNRSHQQHKFIEHLKYVPCNGPRDYRTKQTCGCQDRGGGEGRSGRLGLADENHYT